MPVFRVRNGGFPFAAQWGCDCAANTMRLRRKGSAIAAQPWGVCAAMGERRDCDGRMAVLPVAEQLEAKLAAHRPVAMSAAHEEAHGEKARGEPVAKLYVGVDVSHVEG